MKILKGDIIQVISGKDKGKTGTVVATFSQRNMVVVDGVNVVTRHLSNKRTRSQGQIISKSMPIHVSNVALLQKGKPVRVGYIFEGEGDKRKKIRVSRPGGEKI